MFAERLKEARKAKRYSQAEVSSNHSGCASSCACACASSCACACACAGGGRAGCSVKDFYTVKIPKRNEGADVSIDPEIEDGK